MKPSLLNGTRVIELGTTITAPLASRLLGDLGADVIKIERPEGDPFRRAAFFATYNRNKRSVVLDLTLPGDRERFVELLADADVFLDNVRPGVLERLGIDMNLERERNPGLIHCSITGFGSAGPYVDRPAFDAVAQAIGGMSSLFVDVDEPRLTGPTISDNVAAMYAAIAILAALNDRSRSGTGARLEINMLESTMAFIGDQFTRAVARGVNPQPLDRVAGSQSFIFKCGDGLLVALHLSTLEKFWLGLLAALGALELNADPRFAIRTGRVANYTALCDELGARFATAPREHWMKLLQAHDVPFAPANTMLEALDDPQVQSLRTAYEIPDGRGGTLTEIQSPILVDGRRPREMTSAPALGEHTNDVSPRPSRR